MEDTLITNRIAQLTPTYRSFIESDYLAEVANAFGQAQGFDTRTIEILENALTLHLLFFLDEEQTVSFISKHCKISPEESSVLFLGALSSLPEEIKTIKTATVLPAESSQPEQLTSEIAEAEKAFENIQGIRTMAGDIKEVQSHSTPTYTSRQSDLIHPISTPPPPNTGPRWETDK